ncbi:MAG: mannonate dehydratase [Phycisphaerae bacterium]
MQRRDFLKLTTAAATAGLARSAMLPTHALASETDTPADSKEPTAERMKLGCQRWGSSDKHMPFQKRCGVEAICASPAAAGPDRIWTEDTCRARIKQVREAGLELAAMYWGVPIDVLVPGKRDGAIERCRKQIIAAGKAGIPALQYNLHVRVWRARTGKEVGRGGGQYGAWDLGKVERQRGKRDIGPLSAEDHWDRIEYFLKKVVPVAHEAKVKLSCHPNDPPMPDRNEWKIDQVLDSVEGLKKFVKIQDSPCHGILFCQGCVWEMLPDDRKPEGLYEAIRWFAKRDRIVGVHFRNLRGGPKKFVETYHDEGEIDMFRAAMTYKEAGYTGMLMPDHTPGHQDDPGGLQHFAWAYGYIKGIIQGVYACEKLSRRNR